MYRYNVNNNSPKSDVVFQPGERYRTNATVNFIVTDDDVWKELTTDSTLRKNFDSYFQDRIEGHFAFVHHSSIDLHHVLPDQAVIYLGHLDTIMRFVRPKMVSDYYLVFDDLATQDRDMISILKIYDYIMAHDD